MFWIQHRGQSGSRYIQIYIYMCVLVLYSYMPMSLWLLQSVIPQSLHVCWKTLPAILVGHFEFNPKNKQVMMVVLHTTLKQAVTWCNKQIAGLSRCSAYRSIRPDGVARGRHNHTECIKSCLTRNQRSEGENSVYFSFRCTLSSYGLEDTARETIHKKKLGSPYIPKLLPAIIT